MNAGPDCRECGLQHRSPDRLGVGNYFGDVARSVALTNCHLSIVVHTRAREVPSHAHDWPFLSTLLRGSYVSRTRTREMEYRRGVCVYHPRDFQHRDEIGRAGGLFLAVQLGPEMLKDAERAAPEAGRDVSVLDGNKAYIVLGSLYAALCAGAERFALEALVAELTGCLLAPRLTEGGAMPAWLERTEHRLQDEQHVSLDDLSRDAGVHPTTLTRLFRRYKNCSIGEFHSHVRARRAFFAVVGSKAPLSEICIDAGYADQSHMTRAFRQVFAATPGELRRSAPGAYRIPQSG